MAFESATKPVLKLTYFVTPLWTIFVGDEYATIKSSVSRLPVRTPGAHTMGDACASPAPVLAAAADPGAAAGVGVAAGVTGVGAAVGAAVGVGVGAGVGAADAPPTVTSASVGAAID
jgi:hypothetical protein